MGVYKKGYMADAKSRIRIKRGQIEIEVEGSEEYVNHKFKELKDEFFKQIPTPIPKITEETEHVILDELPDNLPTFLETKGNPQSNQDLALTFAYWLLKKEGVEPFNRSDIERCYSLTRLTPSTNTGMDLRRLQGKGYLIPEEKEGGLAYRLSQRGLEYLEHMG